MKQLNPIKDYEQLKMITFAKLVKFVIVTTLAMQSIACFAFSPATIPISNKSIGLQLKLHKGAATDVYLWKHASGGRGSVDTIPPDIDDENYYGRMSWTCKSSSDITTGACPTYPIWSSGTNTYTTISLQFTEEKTGLKKTLSLKGSSDKALYNGEIKAANRPMESATQTTNTVQSLLNLWIPKEQIENLPIGGTWKASISLNQFSWDPTSIKATWQASITLDVIDDKNIQVYLPNYNTASPTVNLGLKRIPSQFRNPMLAGNVNIDACLYDGYNSKSSSYDITMSDPNSKNRNFYVTTNSNTADPKLSKAIPYQVWVSTPRAPKIVSQQAFSRQVMTLGDVLVSTPTLVTLPNIPNPVFCTPWLINLKTADIAQNNQAAGHYQGTLHLSFTPSSSNL